MRTPVDEALKMAAAQLAQVRFTQLTAPPERDDMLEVIADITAIAKIFDGVIRGIGDYAGEYFDLTIGQKLLFHGVVQGALEGRAIHAIEAAFEAAQEDIEAQEDPRTHSHFEGQD
jgi:hypothetical protein